MEPMVESVVQQDKMEPEVESAIADGILESCIEGRTVTIIRLDDRLQSIADLGSMLRAVNDKAIGELMEGVEGDDMEGLELDKMELEEEEEKRFEEAEGIGEHEQIERSFTGPMDVDKPSELPGLVYEDGKIIGIDLKYLATVSKEDVIRIFGIVNKHLRNFLSNIEISINREYQKRLFMIEAYMEDMYFRMIWELLTRKVYAGTGATHESIVKDGLNNLSKFTTNALTSLQYLKENFMQDTLSFSINRSGIPALNRYLAIGKTISNHHLTRTFFKDKIGSIKGPSGDEEKPFTFLCAPSGQGKTNFALAHAEYLYFVYPSLMIPTPQSVYLPFTSQSLGLFECLNDDLLEYLEAPKNVSKSSLNWDNDSYLEKVIYKVVKDSKNKFRSVGLLYNMIRIVRFECSNGIHASPALAQLSIQQASCTPMSPEEARLGLFGKDQRQVFPIFLDECVLPRTGRNFESLRFMFFRSVIRLMGCTPAFMGTDARASNFLGESRSLSYSSSDRGLVWGVVLFEIPGVDELWLDEQVKALVENVQNWRKNHLWPSEELLRFVFKWFGQEKPLFVLAAIEYFENLMRFDTQTLVDYNDERIFSSLCAFILKKYVQRKSMTDPFNVGQMAYMSAFSWSGVADDLDTPNQVLPNQYGVGLPVVSLNVKRLKSDGYINGHMATLNAIPDADYPEAASICVDIVRTERKARYFDPNSGDKQTGPLFEANSKYPNFADDPALGFICTGVFANDSLLLVKSSKETRFTRASVACSIRWARSESKNAKDPVTDKSTTTGYPLELALNCALIVASHVNGFRGSSLPTFLESVVRELDFEAEYDQASADLYQIHFHPQFPAKLKDEYSIPYCAPMATRMWPLSLLEDIHNIFLKDSLKKEERMRVGVVFPSIKNSRIDCLLSSIIYDHNGKAATYEKHLVVGECKLHDDNIGRSQLLKIIKKFESVVAECDLFILACAKMAAVKGPLVVSAEDEKELKEIEGVEGIPNYEEVKEFGLQEKFKDKEQVTKSSKSEKKDAGLRYCFWKLVRSRRGLRGLAMVPLNEHQDSKAERHVLILEMNELYTGDCFEEHMAKFK